MSGAIKPAALAVCGVLTLAGLVTPSVLATRWQSAAAARLASSESAQPDQPAVAVASEANAGYCTQELRTILRRVLTSCGLLGAGGRGCQPVEARNVATMSGEDFNALFLPMRERGGIVQFGRDASDLDANDVALVDRVFADRRGASYFFVVSRASPDGQVEHNRELSRGRAEAVMAHLRAEFHDPELDRQVGLLWLGEEFAQLDPSFCEWSRSDPALCDGTALNRSAFVAWIDCQL